ncbi:unnamed protein product [Chondrus crispus]|uniref:DDE Tnp4 domain-containing protein n=1 Tax=Chondrus crispus TaxID=2769 RepID=R7QCH5_CHOCR|nr:unnamed protein product [Chondrus crispus]CDF35116.1 unnamed protein product [Chondrus crispus]|eukprot:XP_005714935.1 unnamed protein product [Chondrus crispus]
MFQRRFRITKQRFMEIFDVLQSDRFFTQQKDCTGKLGLSGLQKATAAIRVMAYGGASDALDEYLRIASSTVDICLRKFVELLLRNYEETYLRSPTASDLRLLLSRSSDRGKIASGTYPPPLQYIINGQERNIPYWLVDGIYPKWPCFVHSIAEPGTPKEKLFSNRQESERKDVERAFGVLQAKWHVIARPGRFWNIDFMHKVMKSCIILHNMCVEDRVVHCDTDNDAFDLGGDINLPMWGSSSDSTVVTAAAPDSIEALCAASAFTSNAVEYLNTKKLVMDHLWDHAGSHELEY